MRLKKRILYAFAINILVLVIFTLLPCNRQGFITFCSEGIFQPIGILLALGMQFGIVKNFDSLTYYTNFRSFPNFLQFLIMWSVILLPFYYDKFYPNSKSK